MRGMWEATRQLIRNIATIAAFPLMIVTKDKKEEEREQGVRGKGWYIWGQVGLVKMYNKSRRAI